MKFFVAFFLIFSVLADFSVASYDMASCLSMCEEASICTDAHVDKTEDSNHEQSSGGHACHNHAGHSHVAVLPPLHSVLKSIANDLTYEFPKHIIQNINFYLNEISRPPIS